MPEPVTVLYAFAAFAARHHTPSQVWPDNASSAPAFAYPSLLLKVGTVCRHLRAPYVRGLRFE